jgi:hypothetical protein
MLKTIVNDEADDRKNRIEVAMRALIAKKVAEAKKVKK